MAMIRRGPAAVDTVELNRRAACAATGLEALGVVAGDAVAICLRNDLPFLEAGWGAGLLGAYPVAVNWHYTADEAGYLLRDSGAKVLVIHADLLPAIAGAIPAHVHVLVVPTPDDVRAAYGIAPEAGALPAGGTDWHAWRDGFAPRAGEPGIAPSTIIYTSGTTGRPKGVKRPAMTEAQAAAVATMLAHSYGYADDLADPGRIVTAAVGPMYHAAPNAHANFSARIGAELILMPRFDPEELLAAIETHRITHLNLVPIMFSRLLKLPEAVKRRYDLSSLRYVAHAAAPCPPPIKRGMIDWWGPVIAEYYGSTEMGNVTHCSAAEWLAHPGTVGKPFCGAQVHVIGPDGADLPPRQVGEVVARLPGIGDFTYHGDDEKRRKADRGGFIAPGDIGYLDEDGFLYLCSRSSDMIISGGVNIYPAEIEAELLKLPGVADCAVFGIPDEEYGEAVCAVVQPQAGAHLEAAEVKGFLRQGLAGYKVPRVVAFEAALPREDSGKIFKRKLREPYWAGTGRSI